MGCVYKRKETAVNASCVAQGGPATFKRFALDRFIAPLRDHTIQKALTGERMRRRTKGRNVRPLPVCAYVTLSASCVKQGRMECLKVQDEILHARRGMLVLCYPEYTIIYCNAWHSTPLHTDCTVLARTRTMLPGLAGSACRGRTAPLPSSVTPRNNRTSGLLGKLEWALPALPSYANCSTVR